MVKDFTLNKLIKFIYRETSALEHLEIQNAIEEDEVLRQNYLDLYNGYQELPKVKFFPSKKCISKILSYNEGVALKTI